MVDVNVVVEPAPAPPPPENANTVINLLLNELSTNQLNDLSLKIKMLLRERKQKRYYLRNRAAIIRKASERYHKANPDAREGIRGRKPRERPGGEVKAEPAQEGR